MCSFGLTYVKRKVMVGIQFCDLVYIVVTKYIQQLLNTYYRIEYNIGPHKLEDDFFFGPPNFPKVLLVIVCIKENVHSIKLCE